MPPPRSMSTLPNRTTPLLPTILSTPTAPIQGNQHLTRDQRRTVLTLNSIGFKLYPNVGLHRFQSSSNRLDVSSPTEEELQGLMQYIYLSKEGSHYRDAHRKPPMTDRIHRDQISFMILWSDETWVTGGHHITVLRIYSSCRRSLGSFVPS